MASKTSFEKWFDRLVRHKMGGAAYATAGIAVGLATVGAGTPMPAPIGYYVASIGLGLTGASALLFILFGICYVLKSLKTP